jgi:hypothetical protein
MRLRGMGWVVAIGFGGAAAALAEDITVSTYYPSPRGVYEELHAERVEVKGQMRLHPHPAAGLRPACTEAARGAFWFEQDADIGGIIADRLLFCARVADQYRWIMVLGQ